MKTINNDLIRQFNPCYNPIIKAPDGENLTPSDWVDKYKDTVSLTDRLWVVLHTELVTDKELRLYAVWCAREALKLIPTNTDLLEFCDINERYANGTATIEELTSARNSAKTIATNATREVILDETDKNEEWVKKQVFKEVTWSIVHSLEEVTKEAAWKSSWSWKEAVRNSVYDKVLKKRHIAEDAILISVSEYQMEEFLKLC